MVIQCNPFVAPPPFLKSCEIRLPPLVDAPACVQNSRKTENHNSVNNSGIGILCSKNSNGRLAFPAVAGLLVTIMLTWHLGGRPPCPSLNPPLLSSGTADAAFLPKFCSQSGSELDFWEPLGPVKWKWMSPATSCVRPDVRPSVQTSVRPSRRPSVCPSVCHVRFVLSKQVNASPILSPSDSSTILVSQFHCIDKKRIRSRTQLHVNLNIFHFCEQR